MNYRIEAITLPVSDVDRAKAFYERAGWHLDVDTEPAPGMRVVQLTPPGSDCSITFGIGMGEQSEPGSYRATYLVVSDIVPAHRELKERGIPVTDVFHYGPEGHRSRPGAPRLLLPLDLRRSRREHVAPSGGSQPSQRLEDELATQWLRRRDCP